MSVSVEILPVPLGSQKVQRIRSNLPNDQNDFRVLLVFSENVTGLQETDITVSAGRLLSLTGENSVWEAVLRPPETQGTLTVTLAANAVNEGNAETQKVIRLSEDLPDADAVNPTRLFRHQLTSDWYLYDLIVRPTRIDIIIDDGDTTYARRYTHTGNEISAERQAGFRYRLDWLNGGYIRFGNRYDVNGKETGQINFSASGKPTHNRLGVLGWRRVGSEKHIYGIAYGALGEADPEIKDYGAFPFGDYGLNLMACGDAIYATEFSVRNNRYTKLVHALRVTDTDEIAYLGHANINLPNTFVSAAAYRDKLYILTDTDVSTQDLRGYNPIKAKSRIYPTFARHGEKIDLTKFAPNAERIVFDVGYDTPANFSINANNELVISETRADAGQVALVKCLGINAAENQSFSFYLSILPKVPPIWREIPELTMPANSDFDLFESVEGATAITFRAGQTQPLGSQLSDGVFSIGTTGGVAEFTATNDSGSSHLSVKIDVVQHQQRESSSDVFRYRVLIEEIDVTDDLAELPSVSETLDPVVINEYRVNEASVTLRSDAGRYDEAIVSDNFWTTHGLNRGGFQNRVKIYTEHLKSDGDWERILLFSGLILESSAILNEATVELKCVDISFRLRNARISDFGRLEKWAELGRRSDEADYQGSYTTEASVGPWQVETVEAWSDKSALEVSRLVLPSEGPVVAGRVHPTADELQTAGGYLTENPIVRFKAQPRRRDVGVLIRQLAMNKTVYNTEIDIPSITVSEPFVFNQGNMAVNVEKTRVTRLPVDWEVDATGQRLLILLSNPENHISDVLVQYDLEKNVYRVLYEFDSALAVQRISRLQGTEKYYILTSAAIESDRSQRGWADKPEAGLSYDSGAAGSAIKVWVYDATTQTLTEHVSETHQHRPQLGIYFPVGFENAHQGDTLSGIVREYRGAFKTDANYLYYRFANEMRFGVARVDDSGTTHEVIGVAREQYQDGLNFAFDVGPDGTVYLVYATGTEKDSTLMIKKWNQGSESTVLQATQYLGDLHDVDGIGGAYIGAHECLFHEDYLYIVAPIQLLDEPTSPPTVQITHGPRGNWRMTNRLTRGRYLEKVELSGDHWIQLEFRRDIHGVTASDFGCIGGRVTTVEQSYGRQDALNLTIAPDDPAHDKNIYIDIPENMANGLNDSASIFVDFGTHRSLKKSAGAVVYRCNVTAPTATLEVVARYDFVQFGACNLVIFDGAVHFVEHSPAGKRFTPIRQDLESWNPTLGYNLVPETFGALKRIKSSGEVESLGTLWWTDRPYNVAATRCLTAGNSLHMIMGYGNPDEVLQHNSLASGIENWGHLTYGRTLEYVVPEFPTSRSVYEALTWLATKVGAMVSFEKGLVRVLDRSPYRAKTDGATGIGTQTVNFTDANKTFPEAGYLLIGTEILKYTGITGNGFAGIQRGVAGSEAIDHHDGSQIIYLDNILDPKRYKQITMHSDTNHIYNIIRDSNGTTEISDAESIAKYGERPYTLNLGLSRHERVWTEVIFKRYLTELKDLQTRVNIVMAVDFSLEIGQIVGVLYAGQVQAMRIVSVRYEPTATHIQGRTVS